MVALSTVTVAALATLCDSSRALRLVTRLVLGLPPPQSPPISTVPPPAAPDTSMRAPVTSMFSAETTTLPPFSPLFLPAAEIVPPSLMVCRRRAGRLRGAGRGAQHDHAAARADAVRLDHAPVVDDGIDDPARRRGGELDASAVRAQPAGILHQRRQRSAGLHVAHLRGDRIPDRQRDQLVAVEIERERIAGRQAHRAERRRDGAGVAHAGRDQRGETRAVRRDGAAVDDRGIRPARDVEVVAARP